MNSVLFRYQIFKNAVIDNFDLMFFSILYRFCGFVIYGSLIRFKFSQICCNDYMLLFSVKKSQMVSSVFRYMSCIMSFEPWVTAALYLRLVDRNSLVYNL